MSQQLLLLPGVFEGTGLALKVLKVSAKQGSWTLHLDKMLFHCTFFPGCRRQTLPGGGVKG